MLSVGTLWVIPRLQPATGTLLVLAAGRAETEIATSTVMLSSGSSGWVTVGSVSGKVPAAPAERTMLAVQLAAGSYNGVSLSASTAPVHVSVTAGQVEPLLLGFDRGKLLMRAAYAGNDQVNLGLGELAGKFVPMPDFNLVDQSGQMLSLATLAGKDLVIAAFHTTCHETCPLYTALFLQLAKRIPSTVMLLEVTTDPNVDTPAKLTEYAGGIGAKWIFGTGAPARVAEFWKPFDVDLAGGDTHISTLALVDRHGYVRLVYRGVPKVGSDIPPPLVTSLSAQGLQELASGGDGWGSPDVLQALLTIAGPVQKASGSVGNAPSFTLPSTAGGTYSFSAAAGQPAVINFWASYCPPCKAEMPMLVLRVGSKVGVRLVLIDEGDSLQVARSFLDSLGLHQDSLLDTDLVVGKKYGLSALPMTVFVRSDGTIDRRQVGQLDERVLVAELSNLSSQ